VPLSIYEGKTKASLSTAPYSDCNCSMQFCPRLYMEAISQLYSPVALLHWTGHCVGLRAYLDTAVTQRKKSCSKSEPIVHIELIHSVMLLTVRKRRLQQTF